MGGGQTAGNLEVIDGKVKFVIALPETSFMSLTGTLPENFAKYTVRVNGIDYHVSLDTDGSSYILADESPNGEYEAAMFGNGESIWYDSSPYSNVTIPYSQFYGQTAEEMAGYPRYAAYNEADGNKFVFNDGFALVDILLKGSASITSIKIESKGGKIAGSANYLPSKKQLSITEGMDFVVMNCTNEGNNVPLTDEGVHFCIPVAAGIFTSGITATICDSGHKMMSKDLGISSLSGGEIKSVVLDYSPEEDLLWYEGFDNLVWGGDIMGGENSAAFAPDETVPGVDGIAERTGYENALTPVSYNCPGSGFIQSDTWNDVSGRTVGKSHQTSDLYVKSRGLSDYVYMFRVKEWQGCVSVGKGNAGRGILQTPPISSLKGISDVKASFKFCFQEGGTDDLNFQIMNGGRIRSITVDGTELVLNDSNHGYTGTGSWVIIGKDLVGVPSSEAAEKQWHTAEMNISDATGGTSFYFAGNSTDSGTHGVYVDEMMVYKASEYERGANTLRVLYWNIQNGMWADQANNYSSFTDWVKRYDPDVCVWCEAKTIYKDNTSSALSSGDRYLPSGWATLAARYGHKYVATGGERDNFPQEITSKYEISTLLRITDSDVSGKPISHGAALHSITVNGRDIYFVTLHTWPQSYGYGVASSGQAASTANNEGDYYRQFELRYIMSQTVNNAAYSSQSDWIVSGDFNSRSRHDNWYMGYAEDDTRLIAQDVMINETSLVDIIHGQYPGEMVSTTAGTARIDYMFASPSMYNTVDKAIVITDEWTAPYSSMYVSSFYNPSDHRPILVDFDLSK